jgi:dTDP-4-dehydrorhamnose reductase
MRIIVLGSTGMLGTYVRNYFNSKYKVINISRKDFDFNQNNESDVIDFLVGLVDESSVIINCAGIIKQRNYELKELIKINSLLPNLLYEVKKIVGCKIIHITTDCVYDGLKGDYNENDIHTCNDDYGRSKSLGENKNLTIIRTSIIGEELFNKHSLIEWVKSNKNGTINGYLNHFWNGVTCLELCEFINQMIINNDFWVGIKHILTEKSISKYELLTYINDIFNLNINIIKTNTDTDCYRNLSTVYPDGIIKKSLYHQIKELYNFKIK